MTKKIPFLLATLLLLSACTKPTLTSYVTPLVGTDGHGHTFPGAIVPFGQIQPSPDTRLEGWDGCSGYHYSDDTIYGFSHTHLSGTGCEDYGDVLLMPVDELQMLDMEFGDSMRLHYCFEFSHKDEVAQAGYYSVMPLKGRITTVKQVELTADRRVAYHRYTFEQDKNGIVLDLHHRDVLLSGKIMLKDGLVVGWRESSAWNPDQHLHYAIRSSVPFESVRMSDDSTQAVLMLPDGTKTVQLQVAISGVDIEGAIGNLNAAEYKDFDEARQAADSTWEAALGKLKVKDGTDEQRRCFYTALYHCMTAPYLWSDADGRYRGTDNKIHTVDPGREVYTVFSLWDTYRALHPLLTQIEPERTVDFVYTAMKQYEQGGELPMWELASHETHCMIGYHAVPMMLEAYIHLSEPDGTLAGYTPKQMLDAMVATSNRTEAHRAYAAQGYLSSEIDNESVSKTLEYAYDDWCIAQMAEMAGDTATARTYWIRSQSWQNIIDSNGFAHAKRNGAWLTPFDPTEVNNHFTEANSWQYSTYVPHDIDAWLAHLGGKDRAVAFLDSLFEGRNKLSGRDQADVTGLIGMYAHGNEPSHHAAWLYSLLGQPEKTERYVHKILNELYTSAPDGLCGNEDCGQMSAWYVLAALGRYPVCPGSGQWVETTPLLTPVGTWRATSAAPRTQNTTSAAPRTQHAVSLQCPDSLRITPCPIYSNWRMQITPGREDTFWVPGATKVKFFLSNEKDGDYFQLLNCLADPGEPWTCTYEIPWIPPKLTDFTHYLRAQQQGLLMSQAVPHHLVRTQTDKKVTYLTQPAPQYTENGPEGMVDNIFASPNYRIGGWQGWQGDFVAVVELDKLQTVRSVGLDCLQHMRSWIFFPLNVKVEYSLDGRAWQPFGEVTNSEFPAQHASQEEFIQHTFTAKGYAVTRHLRITARNFGPLPAWHVSAGQQAWLFADEIVIQ